MIKAVLFDLDGTLVNSLADLAASSNFALKEFGFPAHKTESFKYFVGDGMPKLIERILPSEKRDENTIKAVLNVFLEHYKEHYCDNTTEYQGIFDALSIIKEKGISCAVVSNKKQDMAVCVTEKFFGNMFSIVCGKREGFPAKPDPALTLQVIKELNVKPSECLFVGDSGMDMAVAKNAGCLALGVLWGFRKKDELLQNGADFLAEKPSDIVRIIEEIQNG